MAYRLGKMLLNIKYISLVNLVVDKFVVKELIQQYCNPKSISNELDLILNDEAYRSQMLDNYDELNEHLGGAGASARFAKMIYEDLLDK